jgi:Ser/Thr protein kinase RdoA (MazF antagonist)
VLPLSRIVALSETVDEQWRSPVADAVAAAYGVPAGTARFWRSSARHVFGVPAQGVRPDVYLRFAPAELVSRADVVAVATLMQTISASGPGCVEVVPSTTGNLVEAVSTDLGDMTAVMVARAAGSSLDVDELTHELAAAWGAALGVVHRDETGLAVGSDLPDGADRIDRALDSLALDELGPVVAILRSRLHDLPRTPATYGLVHGDFELDNIAWSGGAATAYDWDEAEVSWFAADIAYAVRDLVPDHRELAHGRLPLLDAFLAGYESERPDAQVDREQLALFTSLNALRSLARLAPVLAEDPSVGLGLTSPGAPTLRSRLEKYAAAQHRIAAELAASLG